MSMIAAALRGLLEAGADHELILRTVEAMEAARAAEPVVAPISVGAARQRRYRDRLSVTERNSVTPSDAPLETKVSPTPPSKTQSPSPPLPPLKGVVSPPEADLAEQIWALQPVIGGKRRCTRPEVAKSVKAVLRRGADPVEVLAACRAFYALPASTEDGGKFAKGAVPLLANDGWRDFLPGADARPIAPVFDGPPELRARIAKHAGEDFAAKYVDPARWDGGARALIARNGYSAGKLRAECEALLNRVNVQITTDEPIRATQAA